MPDVFTTTTRTGFGGRMINSIKGILFGILLFLGSFGVLYWNEGRVDISNIAKTAVELGVNTSDAQAVDQNTLIYTSGPVTATEMLGDNLYLKPDTFIALERRVEMFSWVEKQEKKSDENIGGSETTTTTYRYVKEWTNDPRPASDFQYPEGHENPGKILDSATTKISRAKIGSYSFDPRVADLPDLSKVSLNATAVTLESGVQLANDSYLFISKTSKTNLGSPEVGDLRISYYALRPGFDGTMFGTEKGGVIGSYTNTDGVRLHRLFFGGKNEAIATLHEEYLMQLWIFRGVGFVMMWLGLSMVFGPISMFLSIIPIMGTIGRSIIGIATLLVAIPMTFITIVISNIVRNPIAIAISIGIAIVLVITAMFVIKKKKEPVQI